MLNISDKLMQDYVFYRFYFSLYFIGAHPLPVVERSVMLAMGSHIYRHKLRIKKPLTWVSGCCHQINAVRYQAGCLPSSVGGGRAVELDSTFCSSPCMFLM
jgi:hypothetical protein